MRDTFPDGDNFVTAILPEVKQDYEKFWEIRH
jgi:hypothetical protein